MFFQFFDVASLASIPHFPHFLSTFCEFFKKDGNIGGKVFSLSFFFVLGEISRPKRH
jgi:hypothetical protein